MAEATVLEAVEYETNLEDYEDVEELPNGHYRGSIVSVDSRVSAAGNDYWNLQWSIPTDEFPPDYDANNNPDGATAWGMQMRPAEGDRRQMQRTKAFQESLGVANKGNMIDPNEWVGREAMIGVVQEDTPSGIPRLSVKSVEVIE